MPYVAVKGGEQAIQNAESLLKNRRRGDPKIPELTVDQIEQQLTLAVERVMCEGSLYDRELASLAIKQSWGDLVEAVFLLRAYRTTLPRFYYSQPLDTSKMQIQRRISAIFKDVPGGQKLGPTFDYIHRLLDFKLIAEEQIPPAPEAEAITEPVPRVIDTLDQEGLMQPEQSRGAEKEFFNPQSTVNTSTSSVRRSQQSTVNHQQPFDLTREPLTFPAGRDARLQNLARADEGFLLSLAYSTQRGYGRNHPFAGEIRMGEVEVVICPEELGFEIAIADITVTEVQMVNQFKGSKELPAQFTRGYGLTFGYNERKAMSMALVDRAMRAEELGETIQGPAQNVEFVLLHSDNVEAQGFVQHLKLPHYIDFQAELNLVRKIRQQQVNNQSSDLTAMPEESQVSESQELNKENFPVSKV
ncbi:carbon-phosphorus lyase complex subunit PhnI [Calothrix sp. FACHB-1219]|uniref:carbon-phosphorus lyase complex subunit PhnI n=1 Tax=unclassified Calothrix TaxID=2619626 RepID=UPI00168320BF|nr:MULTISPECIES: carbon-phosphorus lyase complex subunit PhnI [unclassified Calothrix]MBD2203850.1 carbon-phosphorus lyase complex subunit PhnI [Calothrix sp. FACHB-168]MBD2219669.1 carbon-phosphorus lyase complex subunit PhnI [Calothrix sp. FACHB-1219]